MMKLVVATILLAATLASASPAGSTDQSCTSDNTECRCRNVITVRDKPALIAAAQECVDRQGINTKVLPGRFWLLPDIAKNCALLKAAEAKKLTDSEGVPDVPAMTTYLRDVIDAEGANDVTKAQADAIVNDIGRCASQVTGTEKALSFYSCLLSSCQEALKA
ncbi:uncharacterized protein LOC135210081 [Macrobrachium nipponense]|uniref:uncharacterized protein LOC135210081 n=1 Tax=Macrobrachium nipponense TaxID=159736 RepID=UPI0030C859DB